MTSPTCHVLESSHGRASSTQIARGVRLTTARMRRSRLAASWHSRSARRCSTSPSQRGHPARRIAHGAAVLAAGPFAGDGSGAGLRRRAGRRSRGPGLGNRAPSADAQLPHLERPAARIASVCKAVQSARAENVFALSLTCRRKFCTMIEGSWRRAATARTVVAPAAFGSRL